MNLRQVYLAMAILGTILPCSQFFQFLFAHGLDVPLFFQQILATPISRFFGADVLVSAIVLFVLIFSEGRRFQIRRLWIPVVGTLSVGVSLGLPLFLYMRQIRLDKTDTQ